MAQGSGFYKGDKKKKKKEATDKKLFSNAPTLILPEIISKKKKWE